MNTPETEMQERKPKAIRSLFRCPPLDRLSRQDAFEAVCFIGASKAKLEKKLGDQKLAGEVAKFIKRLKKGSLMCLADGGMAGCDCDFIWFFHPDHGRGILASIWEDGPDISSWVEISSTTSKVLGRKLGILLRDIGYVPDNLHSCSAYFPKGAIEKKDLIKALVYGVYFEEGDNAISAATEYVGGEENE